MPSTTTEPKQNLPKVVWYLVDGLPWWLIERFAWQRPGFEFLSKLMEQGRVARLEPAFPNCQTPPSLFSIWTGVPEVVHGLTGYDVPLVAGEDPLAMAAGFVSWPRGFSPIWEHYSQQGARVALANLPFLDYSRIAYGRSAVCSGFVQPVIKPQLVWLDERASSLEATLPGTPYRLCVVPNGKSYTMQIWSAAGVAGHCVLELGRWSVVQLTTGRAMHLTLERLDGRLVLVLAGAWDPQLFGSSASLHEAQHEPFTALGLAKLYRSGALGTKLAAGGSGAAETLLLESLRHVRASFLPGLRAPVATGLFDLVVAYQPFFDLLGHELIGLLDSDRAELAQYAQELFVEGLFDLQGTLQWLAESTPPDTRVIICSDHGMTPVRGLVYPNEMLRRLELLAVDERGGLDWRRSAAFYHPAENGALCINTEVCEQRRIDVGQIVSRLGAELRAATDQEPTWHAARSAESGVHPIEIAGYLDAGHGVQAKVDLGKGVRGQAAKTGDHTVGGDDPKLRGAIIDLHGNILAGRARLETHELVRAVIGRDIN